MTLFTLTLISARSGRRRAKVTVYVVHPVKRPTWEGARFYDGEKAWAFVQGLNEKLQKGKI